MLARLALLSSLVAAASLATAQVPEPPEPEFVFVMSGITFSTHEPLAAGDALTVTVPVRRLCALEMAVLDEQRVLVTLTSPAFRFDAPLFLAYATSLCPTEEDPVALEVTATALAGFNGSQSFTVRLDPQPPENGLHGAGEPQTLLVGVALANETAPPTAGPVAPPEKESPPAALGLGLAAVVGASAWRRRSGA